MSPPSLGSQLYKLTLIISFYGQVITHEYGVAIPYCEVLRSLFSREKPAIHCAPMGSKNFIRNWAPIFNPKKEYTTDAYESEKLMFGDPPPEGVDADTWLHEYGEHLDSLPELGDYVVAKYDLCGEQRCFEGYVTGIIEDRYDEPIAYRILREKNGIFDYIRADTITSVQRSDLPVLTLMLLGYDLHESQPMRKKGSRSIPYLHNPANDDIIPLGRGLKL